MLRHSADYRTVLYLVGAVVLSAVQWHLGHIVWPLYVLGLFLSLSTAVISHNHNHLGIWKSPLLNQLTGYLLSFFYGYPVVGWIPTHNQVHHKLNNRPGDSSRSPKFFKKNHLAALLVYPTLTAAAQTPEIFAYIRDLGRRDRKAFWLAWSEFGVFLAFMAVIFVIDWKKALLFFFIPQQFALFMIQVFNYVQHIETDADSKWNHSRNFVSPVLNALLFNNGYHTVHHLKPGVHWSQTPALHREHAHKIDPSLLVRSWWGYMASTFLLRPFVDTLKAPELRLTTGDGLEAETAVAPASENE